MNLNSVGVFFMSVTCFHVFEYPKAFLLTARLINIKDTLSVFPKNCSQTLKCDQSLRLQMSVFDLVVHFPLYPSCYRFSNPVLSFICPSASLIFFPYMLLPFNFLSGSFKGLVHAKLKIYHPPISFQTGITFSYLEHRRNFGLSFVHTTGVIDLGENSEI